MSNMTFCQACVGQGSPLNKLHGHLSFVTPRRHGTRFIAETITEETHLGIEAPALGQTSIVTSLTHKFLLAEIFSSITSLETDRLEHSIGSLSTTSHLLLFPQGDQQQLLLQAKGHSVIRYLGRLKTLPIMLLCAIRNRSGGLSQAARVLLKRDPYPGTRDTGPKAKTPSVISMHHILNFP